MHGHWRQAGVCPSPSPGVGLHRSDVGGDSVNPRQELVDKLLVRLRTDVEAVIQAHPSNDGDVLPVQDAQGPFNPELLAGAVIRQVHLVGGGGAVGRGRGHGRNSLRGQWLWRVATLRSAERAVGQGSCQAFFVFGSYGA